MDFEFEKPLQPLRDQIAALQSKHAKGDAAADAELTELQRRLEAETAKLYANLTAWDIVQIARHPGRPTCRQYAEKMCDEFIELHGDRVFGDDPAILGGLARIGNTRFMLIGHQKGATTEERMACRFGMANPEGYRKAIRLMHVAEKWGIPVVTLVDTAGAYPGLDARLRLHPVARRRQGPRCGQGPPHHVARPRQTQGHRRDYPRTDRRRPHRCRKDHRQCPLRHPGKSQEALRRHQRRPPRREPVPQVRGHGSFR